MATALVIAEERGTCTGFLHGHNGYFAGSFTTSLEVGPTRPSPPLARVHRLVFGTAQVASAAA